MIERLNEVTMDQESMPPEIREAELGAQLVQTLIEWKKYVYDKLRAGGGGDEAFKFPEFGPEKTYSTQQFAALAAALETMKREDGSMSREIADLKELVEGYRSEIERLELELESAKRQSPAQDKGLMRKMAELIGDLVSARG